MTIDPTQLKVGSYIRYDMSRFGIVTDPAIKIMILDKDDNAYYVDGVRAQLWWTSAAGRPHLLREDDIPLNKIEELLGEKELPKPIEEVKQVRMAPNRPDGYKDCDRKGCDKTIYGVISTQAMRQTYKGFKFGDITAENSPALVALCSVHYKQRDQYGIVGLTWTAYPKPPEKPTDTQATPTPPETPAKPAKRSNAYSDAPEPIVEATDTVRKDGKVDGRSNRWKNMTPEQRKAQAQKMAQGRWKK